MLTVASEVLSERGGDKIGREAPKKIFIAPLGNFAGGKISVWALCIGNGT